MATKIKVIKDEFDTRNVSNICEIFDEEYIGMKTLASIKSIFVRKDDGHSMLKYDGKTLYITNLNEQRDVFIKDVHDRECAIYVFADVQDALEWLVDA